MVTVLMCLKCKNNQLCRINKMINQPLKNFLDRIGPVL